MMDDIRSLREALSRWDDDSRARDREVITTLKRIEAKLDMLTIVGLTKRYEAE